MTGGAATPVSGKAQSVCVPAYSLAVTTRVLFYLLSQTTGPAGQAVRFAPVLHGPGAC